MDSDTKNVGLMSSPNDFNLITDDFLITDSSSENLDLLLTLDDLDYTNNLCENIFQSQEENNQKFQLNLDTSNVSRINAPSQLINNFKEDDEMEYSDSDLKETLNTEISQISGINMTLNTQFDDFVYKNNSVNTFSLNATNDLFIPNSIFSFYKRIKESLSDWSFIFALAAQIGSNLTPMNCFVNLKISLLLSIVSIQNNKKVPPLPIIAIGDDTSTINLIMSYFGNLAQRLITPLDEFYGGCFISKNNVIHAGPIVLASGGVCYIGDWERMKESSVRRLFKNIESGRVLLEKSTVTVPLECSIWTYWNCNKMQTKNINLLNTFMNVFGVPIIIVDDNNNEDIIDFLLTQATENADDLFLNSNEAFLYDDLKRFLVTVTNLNVTMSTEASELLRNYFITTRIEKPESLTQRAFISLELMAESFAKLSLRDIVLKCDAIAAIYMTENFVKFAYGTDTRSSPSCGNFNQIEEVEENMRNFETWCYDYISILNREEYN